MMTEQATKWQLSEVINPTVTRIIPELAKEIGLNESIVLLQISYWIGISKNVRDGVYWTYHSLREMQKDAFPYWSIETIRRTIKSLVDSGYIVIGNYNRRKGDNTQWFALEPDKLSSLKSVIVVAVSEGGVSKRDRVSQDETPPQQNETTLPETTTENTQNTLPPNPRKRGNKGRASKGDVYTTFEQLPIASTLYDLFSGGVVPAQNQLQAALMDYVKAAQELTARGETAERVKRAYCNMQRFATEQDWTKGFGLSAFMKRYVEMVDKYPNVPAAPAKALDLSEWTADSVWGWSAES